MKTKVVYILNRYKNVTCHAKRSFLASMVYMYNVFAQQVYDPYFTVLDEKNDKEQKKKPMKKKGMFHF